MHLTAPRSGEDQKPRIIRVMANGQEQEYIITTTTDGEETVPEANFEDTAYNIVSTTDTESVLPEVYYVCIAFIFFVFHYFLCTCPQYTDSQLSLGLVIFQTSRVLNLRK